MKNDWEGDRGDVGAAVASFIVCPPGQSATAAEWSLCRWLRPHASTLKGKLEPKRIARDAGHLRPNFKAFGLGEFTAEKVVIGALVLARLPNLPETNLPTV